MKYYFITYQAKNRDGDISVWNQVIDTSPMEFIKEVESCENEGTPNYYNFVVINTCEINKKLFDTYKGRF